MKRLFTFFAILTIANSYIDAQEIDSIKPTTGIPIISWIILPEAIIADYQADKKTPVSFQNIAAKEIAPKNTGQEPSFLLSETPSMTVYSDAGSYQGYSYFRLRGIDQTRLNMTLDGVPLNEPEDQGVYFSNYPDFLNSVAKIQLQRGVGTTKNGTTSYGGSLQFSSASLHDKKGGMVGAGYGSYNTYRAFAEYNTGVNDKLGFYVRGSHLHSDGYRNRSANTSSSLFYKGGYFHRKNTLKLTGFVGNQLNEMAWLGVSQEDIDLEPKTNANAEEDDRFTQSLTMLEHSFYLNDESTIRSSIYYNFLDGNYDFDLNNFLGFPSTEELYNYAFRSHFIGLFSNYSYEKKVLKITTGVHGNRYSRRHTGSELALGELYQNTGFKQEFSAFAKTSYSYKKLNFFADLQLRYTNFDYEGATQYEGDNWLFFNPKVGLSYQVKNDLSLYYSFGRTGREPTRTDLFGGADELEADSSGNPFLVITEPEYVIDHELGVRFKSNKTRLNANLYFMNFDNEITLSGQFGPNGLALNSKVENSLRAGLEIDFQYQALNWLKLINNSSFNYSRIQEQGESFSPILTPKVIINQEFVGTYKKFETGISLRYQSSSYIDFANANSVDGYFLANWRASYALKNWKLSLFINNLTNTRYYNQGYVDFDGTNKYFVQAPVNFYGMVSFTF